MRASRAAILITCALVGSATHANAAPIVFRNGVLDATLRLYTLLDFNGATGSISVSEVVEYELGVDFMPGVPQPYLDNLLPYSECIDTLGDAALGPCTSQVRAIVPPGTPVSAEFNANPALLAALLDGCDPFVGFQIALVSRGGCTFTQKAEVAAAGGFGGVLVANTVPGLFTPFLEDVPIPLFLITSAVAEQIRVGTPYTVDGVPQAEILHPVVQMDVTWTPNAVPVPEPGSLLLLGMGLSSAVAFRRRKKR